MKKLLVLALSMMLFVNCEDGKKSKRILSSSSGNINDLSVVVDNNLWEGRVGESIRNVLGDDVYGLPQDEPLFSLRQMPTVVFTDFARKNRIVFKVEKGKPASTKYIEDAFASPQKVVLVTGKTDSEIINEIETNAKKIVSEFKTEELKEKQKRIKKSLHKTTEIEDALDITLRFPSAYRIAKEGDKFFWIRRDIETGTLNIMLYEMPINAITEGEDAILDVIKIRDSIGKQYIPGPTEGTYMTTEEAYTPFMQQTIVDNKPTLETKSTWEVEGAWMSGPFINYAIKDEINNRYIIVEGFAYAPAVSKRDFVFELEAIIKSIHIK
ncbi:MAG: DUF4837 family protein [Flavobacteriaceae bacterium]|nr:DUF4837 family protein [Flavobacteriaceae bacterium]